MTLALDLPRSSASPLGRLDPRWRLAALLLAAAVAAALRSWPAALAALLGSWSLAILARLPLRWYLVRLATVSVFLALFVVFLPFVPRRGEVPWEVGPLELSPGGVELAAVICLKAAAVVTLVLVLWAAAPWEVTLKAARSLRLPGLAVHLLALTYRYLFLLAEEMNRLRVALRVRGYRNRANLHSYHTVGQVAGTLLVRSHERAERVGQAMRCRGFDGTYRALTDFRTRVRDVVAFALIVGAAAGLVLWDALAR
jgi:cobalt/nickel transport system permease protein